MISAEVTIKTQFYDLDPMDVVWHGNYPRFLEQARCALLDRIDFNYVEMSRSGYLWPIVDMRIKYVAAITFAQEILVSATLVEFENRLKIAYRITDRQTGQLLTKAETVQVAVDESSQELCLDSPAILLEKVANAR
jgi:acyl-CoA thioester hydrolase